ncbi:MAG: hypothetical protein Q9160_008910 [Pyrenula sp. 1 TL-2023]
MHSSCEDDGIHFDVLLRDTLMRLGELIESAKDRTRSSRWDHVLTPIYWDHFRQSTHPADESKKIIHERLSYIHHEATALPGRIMFRCDDPDNICDTGGHHVPVYLYPKTKSNWINVCWQFYSLNLLADHRQHAAAPISRAQAIFREISKFPAVFDREPFHTPLVNRYANTKNVPNVIDDAGVYYHFVKAVYRRYHDDHPDDW